MGFFSEIDIAISEMIADGATRKQVRDAYPMLRDDEIDSYFDNEHDGDYEAIARDEYDDLVLEPNDENYNQEVQP